MTTHPALPPAKPQRRRPRQSRARLTAEALQQAFVQLLVERDYERITIREITGLAGTSLGSFYEYFASKEDLARVCLHLRSKALLGALQAVAQAPAGRPLDELVQAVLVSQLAAHQGAAAEWAAHYLLERHLSGVAAYRKMYQRFVEAWELVLQAAADLPQPPPTPLPEVARACQTLLYGLVAHAHLGSERAPDLAALQRQASQALRGYLGQALMRPA
ncbi:TetR/AcrR family transcriptional regulator [Curvibacter sp. HBC28]|uniref:TetR/AcrR family transcriptional regulator n=1 Tax=Curvibacter microcysteis TaxID=3026419 RepID=A0ABT5MHN9_9BURK|nr:TetR/AcrR family transcriptional regulator [Curvibacter sp. HBC28]MDD0816095.1 TetR/AcrR family transcriptional regulator [Curvibacter sp. HBC28]